MRGPEGKLATTTLTSSHGDPSRATFDFFDINARQDLDAFVAKVPGQCIGEIGLLIREDAIRPL